MCNNAYKNSRTRLEMILIPDRYRDLQQRVDLPVFCLFVFYRSKDTRLLERLILSYQGNQKKHYNR